MSTEIKVPVLPESVSDATIASWHKKPGDAVKRDENLVDLETDKVVLEVPSPVDGVLKEIKFDTGATVTSEQVLAIVEAGAAASGDDKAGSGTQRTRRRSRRPTPGRSSPRAMPPRPRPPSLPRSPTRAMSCRRARASPPPRKASIRRTWTAPAAAAR